MFQPADPSADKPPSQGDSWGLGQVIDRLGPSVFVGLLMPDGTLVHANHAALELVDAQPGDVVGHPFEKTPWWRDLPAVQPRLRAAIETAAGGEPSRFELDVCTTHRGPITVDFSLQPVFDGAGKVAFLVPSGFDVSERRAAEQRMSHMTDHDALTGLPNRRFLRRRLDVKLQRARDEQRRLALLVIDLDRFGHVNAALGSAGGDEVLRTVAERINAALCPGDKAARFGGDEFVVALGPNRSADEAAVQAALALLDALSAPMVVDGREVAVTASIGVASVDPAESDAERLLRAAGVALDRAKTMGRNTYAVHTPERFREDPERPALEESLRHALRRGQLHLVYQPQVDLASGEMTGVEALLRWDHPDHGPVSPECFIPIAEETGLIGPIGEWVVRRASAAAAAWHHAGLPPLRMSVNVSALQLQQPGFADRVLSILRDEGLDARRFGVELTESVPMHRLDEIAAQLQTLRARGVEIALDDFGTGYSSLSCLRRLPIDVVKIDRSLVPAIVARTDALSIARAIIAMAHSLGMKVLAEGVENEGQLEWLSANRCDRFQGYHFSKPVDAGDITTMLRAGRKLSLGERRRAARSGTVLVVDDEAWVVNRLKQQLQWRFAEAVRVETCADARTALRRIGETPFDVVASDLRMPDLDGIALLDQVRLLQPDAVRMMLLGPSDLARAIHDERQLDVFRYISKPWTLDSMLLHFQSALREASRRRGQRALNAAVSEATYAPSDAELELRRVELQEPGITAVDRGLLDEVLLPSQLMTLPGDLWVPKDKGSAR